MSQPRGRRIYWKFSEQRTDLLEDPAVGRGGKKMRHLAEFDPDVKNGS
jgi:hypothetical protein